MIFGPDFALYQARNEVKDHLWKLDLLLPNDKIGHVNCQEKWARVLGDTR